MNPSRYNILTPISEDAAVLFNTRTGRAVKLNQDRVKDYELFLEAKCRDDEFLSALKALDMAVDQEHDELATIRTTYHETIDNTKRLTATIALTEACNFRCGYCYQSHENTREDAAIERTLIDLLEAAQSDSASALHINWFGGEPLLKIDLLERLSSIARNYATENSWKFTQFITTNGSLLDGVRANRLRAVGVSSYQITLDGPADHHNQQRPLKGGAPSYAAVLDGIREAIKVGASLVLRINLSRPISDGIDLLIQDLLASGCNRQNTTVHVVRAIDHDEGRVDAFFLSNEEFAHAWVKCLRKIKDAGFHLPHLLPIPYNCSFDTGKTVFVDHRGAHGFCTSIPSVDTKSNAAGIKPIRFFPKQEKGVKYGVKKRSDAFFDSDCGSCQFLPACGGGCQYLEAAGQEKCTPEKYVFPELIRLHYAN